MSDLFRRYALGLFCNQTTEQVQYRNIIAILNWIIIERYKIDTILQLRAYNRNMKDVKHLVTWYVVWGLSMYFSTSVTLKRWNLSNDLSVDNYNVQQGRQLILIDKISLSTLIVVYGKIAKRNNWILWN